MAGIKLGIGAQWCSSEPFRRAGSVLVTVSARPGPCPAPMPDQSKVTPFGEYPGKGRGTGGVRCHRFIKGEDVLLLTPRRDPHQRWLPRRAARYRCLTPRGGATARALRRANRSPPSVPQPAARRPEGHHDGSEMQSDPLPRPSMTCSPTTANSQGTSISRASTVWHMPAC